MAREAWWRDTGRRPRFFIFDIRAAFPLALCLLHLRAWTVTLALVCTVIFGILERYGFTPEVALRLLRSWAAGPVRVARPWWVDRW